MLARTLDLDSVIAFVRVVDLASFTRAAEALDTSQAGISLRLKRLEDRLGARLLDRTPRHVTPTRQGERFLPAARRLIDAHDRAWNDLVEMPPERLRLGISDHVAGPDLARLLARLGLDRAGLVAEVRIQASRDLIAAFGDGAYEAVIVRMDEGAETVGAILAEERLAWFAAPEFRPRPGEPLRLATLASPCNVRAAAELALDSAGLPWCEAFIGGGVLAVGAAVAAGLGVAALAPSTAPVGAVEAGLRLGLPELPLTRVVLHERPLRGRAADAVRALAAAYRRAGS